MANPHDMLNEENQHLLDQVWEELEQIDVEIINPDTHQQELHLLTECDALKPYTDNFMGALEALLLREDVNQLGYSAKSALTDVYTEIFITTTRLFADKPIEKERVSSMNEAEMHLPVPETYIAMFHALYDSLEILDDTAKDAPVTRSKELMVRFTQALMPLLNGNTEVCWSPLAYDTEDYTIGKALYECLTELALASEHEEEMLEHPLYAIARIGQDMISAAQTWEKSPVAFYQAHCYRSTLMKETKEDLDAHARDIIEEEISSLTPQQPLSEYINNEIERLISEPFVITPMRGESPAAILHGRDIERALRIAGEMIDSCAQHHKCTLENDKFAVNSLIHSVQWLVVNAANGSLLSSTSSPPSKEEARNYINAIFMDDESRGEQFLFGIFSIQNPINARLDYTKAPGKPDFSDEAAAYKRIMLIKDLFPDTAKQVTSALLPDAPFSDTEIQQRMELVTSMAEHLSLMNNETRDTMQSWSPQARVKVMFDSVFPALTPKIEISHLKNWYLNPKSYFTDEMLADKENDLALEPGTHTQRTTLCGTIAGPITHRHA